MTEPVLTTRPRGKRATVPAPTKSTSPSPALDAIAAARPVSPFRDLPAHELRPHPANPEHRSTEGFEELAEQIRADGKIRQPLIVRPVADGYEVLSGSRRLAAARLLGHILVPAEVVDVDDRTALRMVLAENLNRMDFTPSEEATLVQDLLDLGLTDQALAVELGKGKEWIARRRAVAKLTKPARSIIDARPDLDLVKAAETLDAVAEFEDAPDVVEHLTAVAVTEPAQLAHAVSLARRARREAELEEPEKSRLEAAGYEVLAESPYGNPNIRALRDLTAQPPTATRPSPALTNDEHAHCPGRAVRVYTTGTTDNLRLHVEGYCTTWKTAGHFNRHANPSSGSTSGPRTEEEKAKRKHLIDTNRAAEAAKPVRRAWLEEFFRRDKMPTDSLVYAAQILAKAYTHPSHANALALLGIKHNGYALEAEALKRLAKPITAHKHLVALAVTVVEDSMPKDFWREKNSWYFGRHLSQLQAWGYTLAPHEQTFVDTWAETHNTGRAS